MSVIVLQVIGAVFKNILADQGGALSAFFVGADTGEGFTAVIHLAVAARVLKRAAE